MKKGRALEKISKTLPIYARPAEVPPTQTVRQDHRRFCVLPAPQAIQAAAVAGCRSLPEIISIPLTVRGLRSIPVPAAPAISRATSLCKSAPHFAVRDTAARSCAGDTVATSTRICNSRPAARPTRSLSAPRQK